MEVDQTIAMPSTDRPTIDEQASDEQVIIFVPAKPSKRRLKIFHRFLDLPAELRIHIYLYAILLPYRPHLGPTRPSNSKLLIRRKWNFDTLLYKLQVPALAQVSRLVRAEVLPLYYIHQRFRLPSLRYLNPQMFPAHPFHLLRRFVLERNVIWDKKVRITGATITMTSLRIHFELPVTRRSILCIPDELDATAFHSVTFEAPGTGRTRVVEIEKWFYNHTLPHLSQIVEHVNTHHASSSSSSVTQSDIPVPTPRSISFPALLALERRFKHMLSLHASPEQDDVYPQPDPRSGRPRTGLRVEIPLSRYCFYRDLRKRVERREGGV